MQLLVNDDAESMNGLRPPAGVTQLSLVGSKIASFAYFSTYDHFSRVRVLKAPQVGLTSLSGLDSFPNLRELYVPFNHIRQLDELWGNEGLEILDLEGNDVSDPSNVLILQSMSSLKEVDLAGTPIVKLWPGLSAILPQVPFSPVQSVPSTADSNRARYG